MRRKEEELQIGKCKLEIENCPTPFSISNFQFPICNFWLLALAIMGIQAASAMAGDMPPMRVKVCVAIVRRQSETCNPFDAGGLGKPQRYSPEFCPFYGLRNLANSARIGHPL